MLCPSCGKSVGDTLALCDACHELKEVNDSEVEVTEQTNKEEVFVAPTGRDQQPSGSDLIGHPLVVCIVGLIIFLCFILMFILLG